MIIEDSYIASGTFLIYLYVPIYTQSRAGIFSWSTLVKRQTGQIIQISKNLYDYSVNLH